MSFSKINWKFDGMEYLTFALQGSRPVTKFTEDFDFMAMNEKFKKDEVWGHLGKGNKSQSRDKEVDGKVSDEDDYEDEDDAELPKFEVKVGLLPRITWTLNLNFNKQGSLLSISFLLGLVVLQPIYNKDDFFDSLSCNALDHDSHNGRTRFSEQMKIDTEVKYPLTGFCLQGSYFFFLERFSLFMVADFR